MRLNGWVEHIHSLRSLMLCSSAYKCSLSCRHASFFSLSNTNTALLPVYTHKSRALLSVESSSVDSVQHNKALMTVSTGLTNYDMDAEFRRPKRTISRSKGRGLHTCSCANRNYSDSGINKQGHNRTLFKK